MRSAIRAGLVLVAVGWALASRPAGAADDALAIIDGYMAAWNAHDTGKAASFFADDVEYFDASIGEAQKGKQAATEKVVQTFITAAPDLKWQRDPAKTIVGADGIAFQWTFGGTNTGAWADGTPATGKPFSFQGATVIKIKNGKIAYQGDFYDALGFYRQLGLIGR